MLEILLWLIMSSFGATNRAADDGTVIHKPGIRVHGTVRPWSVPRKHLGRPTT